ncbi:MAG: hypothetical protein JW846_08280 [Dehalococcoidia bacterium]|nr:hypothetical protein [Dehalococcoidia bacterium]
MAVEISGITPLSFQLDNAAAALAATDTALVPVQGAGSVAVYHAIQDGFIRGLDCEIETAQDDGDDVIFSVYVGGTRDDDSAVTLSGAGTAGGATYGTQRFDKGGIPVSEGDSIVVKAKSTDAANCTPAGMVAVVILQLGESEI